MRFDIQPYTGTLPITFGMTRAEVHRLLGPSESSHPVWEGSGVAVSSDGWGVMTALNGQLVDLARWLEIEPTLVDRLETLIRVWRSSTDRGNASRDWGGQLPIAEVGRSGISPTTHEEALARCRKARVRFRETVERFRGWQRGMVAREQDI